MTMKVKPGDYATYKNGSQVRSGVVIYAGNGWFKTVRNNDAVPIRFLLAINGRPT